MSHYVVTYAYSADTAARDAVRPTHREYLASLPELVLSGPTDADGAFMIFDADSAATVEKLLDGDPFTTDGRIIAERSVVGWTPVLGRLAPSLA